MVLMTQQCVIQDNVFYHLVGHTRGTTTPKSICRGTSKTSSCAEFAWVNRNAVIPTPQHEIVAMYQIKMKSECILFIAAKLACCGGYCISIQKIVAEVPLHINFGVVVLRVNVAD